MMRRTIVMVGFLGACGGGKKDPVAAGAETPAAEPAYAPLDVGADYKSYTKVNKETFVSPTHGKRFVDIYVNDVGLAAYTSDAEFPVGSIVVKTSWETADGKPTDVAGPIFVMEKKAAGFSPDHGDWWYGLHWENVPASWQPKMGGATQVYWRSPSAKVNYCWECHDNFDRAMGLPPAEQRTWSVSK